MAGKPGSLGYPGEEVERGGGIITGNLYPGKIFWKRIDLFWYSEITSGSGSETSPSSKSSLLT